MTDLQRPPVEMQTPAYSLYDNADFKKLGGLRLSQLQAILFGLLIHSAMMRSEIQDIERGDLKGCVLSIRGQRPRQLTLPGALVDLIKKSFKKKPRTYLFESKDGGPLSEVTLAKIIKPALEKIGLKADKAMFKRFRETFILNHPEQAQQTAGFTSRTNFKTRYLTLRPEIVKAYEKNLYEARDRKYRGKDA